MKALPEAPLLADGPMDAGVRR